jgi:hypothetical protein
MYSADGYSGEGGVGGILPKKQRDGPILLYPARRRGQNL